jgi:hypothetical protein
LLSKTQLASPFERAAVNPPLQPALHRSSFAAPPVFDRRGRWSARNDLVRRLERRVAWISAVGLSVWIAWGAVVQLAVPLHRITP